MSPWSPPVWMKINHDYPVSPSKYNEMDERQGYLLYMDDGKNLDADEMKLLGDRNGVFPAALPRRITSSKTLAICNAMPTCSAASSNSTRRKDCPSRK